MRVILVLPAWRMAAACHLCSTRCDDSSPARRNLWMDAEARRRNAPQRAATRRGCLLSDRGASAREKRACCGVPSSVLVSFHSRGVAAGPACLRIGRGVAALGMECVDGVGPI